MDIYSIMANVKKVVISVIGERNVLLVIKLMNLEKIVHLVILDIIYFLLKIKQYVNIVIQIIAKNANIFQEKSNVQNAIQILFWQMDNAYKVVLEVAQIVFTEMENGHAINAKKIIFYKRSEKEKFVKNAQVDAKLVQV
jgi:hypothetical protein